MTGPSKDFTNAGADIPVTPEEDAYFKELEGRDNPAPVEKHPKAMSFEEYEFHCKRLRQGAFFMQNRP